MQQVESKEHLTNDVKFNLSLSAYAIPWYRIATEYLHTECIDLFLLFLNERILYGHKYKLSWL